MAEESNPYVGPRSFRDGEFLYGRDDETQRLFDLLLAERIVLLYSPSGAGKTSLLQARIVPKLRAEGFRIFSKIRVNAAPPHTDEIPAGDNRYAFATKYTIDQDQPNPCPIDLLAAKALPDCFAEHFASESAPIALIFDQFEEVLTLDPSDEEAKSAFFLQLGTALRANRRIWALFAMREEFIAALDPYLSKMPTRLQTRFRLNLLDRANAVLAIREPAENAGVDFKAAETLAKDLSSMRVQRHGRTEEVTGPWVEPVQLQVVCRSLWKKPRKNPKEISDDDLTGVTDVNTALGDYYDERIGRIVDDGLATERAIRDWFTQNLITERGIRAQVLSDESSSGGLSNDAVERLRDDHLIRAEERRGAVWYELAHDRLVEPIRASNRRWSQTHLEPFQAAAARYKSSGKPEDLLRDAPLVAAKRWIDAHPNEVTAQERQFVAESITSLDAFRKALFEWEMSGRKPELLLKDAALKQAETIADQSESLTRSEETLLRISMNERRWRAQRRIWLRWSTIAIVLLLGYSLSVQWELRKELRTTAVDKAKEAIGQFSLASQQPTTTQDVLHRYEAQAHLAEITASVPPSRERSDVTVEYFLKPSDAAQLTTALTHLGFKVITSPPNNPRPTNCIWYGSQVDPNDVKLVALAAIRAGIAVQGIQPFIATDVKQHTVQIGHNPRIEDQPAMSGDEIANKTLAQLKRREVPPIGGLHGVVTQFDPARHEGMIESKAPDEESVYFKTSPDVRPFKAGDPVSFTLFKGSTRHYAVDVTPVSPPKQ